MDFYQFTCRPSDLRSFTRRIRIRKNFREILQTQVATLRQSQRRRRHFCGKNRGFSQSQPVLLSSGAASARQLPCQQKSYKFEKFYKNQNNFTIVPDLMSLQSVGSYNIKISEYTLLGIRMKTRLRQI